MIPFIKNGFIIRWDRFKLNMKYKINMKSKLFQNIKDFIR
jgi:hypothetical protein